MNTASLTQTEFSLTQTARPSDYIALMKPRVMSLVIFTAFTGLVCAPGHIDLVLGAASILAVAAGAGAAGALNMWYDADIDAKMSRTRTRPIPSGRVAPSEALALGLVVSIFSVLLMALAANYVAAGLLAFTIVFYAVFYTMVLKRRTDQNIVIGGLAGALPPAVAWAAVTGDVPLNAWLMVALIFLWTPAHFWALALYQSADFQRAGLPMLPVTRGAKSARAHILAYSVLTALIGVVPAFTGLGGGVYAAVSIIMGVTFMGLGLRVFNSRAGDIAGAAGEGGALYNVRVEALPARDLFAFSILYLFVMFAVLLGENLIARLSGVLV
ncbi:MAG: heme o synthase [Caulobacterales bacterium]